MWEYTTDDGHESERALQQCTRTHNTHSLTNTHRHTFTHVHSYVRYTGTYTSVHTLDIYSHVRTPQQHVLSLSAHTQSRMCSSRPHTCTHTHKRAHKEVCRQIHTCMHVQLALRICEFCIADCRLEIFRKKIPESSDKQNLNLPSNTLNP